MLSTDCQEWMPWSDWVDNGDGTESRTRTRTCIETATETRPRAHADFEALVAHPTHYRSWDLRSDALLDTLKNTKPPKTEAIAMVYDPVMDAALGRLVAGKNDLNGKHLPLHLPLGSTSWFLAYEFQHNEAWRWRGEGYSIRHKTWYHYSDGLGILLQGRTDYKHAANEGKFNEVFIACPSGAQFTVPGQSGTGQPWHPWYGEGLGPIVGQMFFEPDEWVRVYELFEDFDQPIIHLSMWAATKAQGVVQCLDRVALKTPVKPGQDSAFREVVISYDASGEHANKNNPDEMRCWHRNYAVLVNIDGAEARTLVKPPPG